MALNGFDEKWSVSLSVLLDNWNMEAERTARDLINTWFQLQLDMAKRNNINTGARTDDEVVWIHSIDNIQISTETVTAMASFTNPSKLKPVSDKVISTEFTFIFPDLSGSRVDMNVRVEPFSFKHRVSGKKVGDEWNLQSSSGLVLDI